MVDLSLERKDQAVPKGLQTWNTDAFVDALRAVNPELDWRAVADALDEAGCYVPNFAGFLLILRVYRRAVKVGCFLHARWRFLCCVSLFGEWS
jgi:hypothetical protein